MFTQKLVYQCPQQLYSQNPQQEDKQLHCSSQGKTTQQWKGRRDWHGWQARRISRESSRVRKADFNTSRTTQFHLGNVVAIPNSNNRKQINNCQWLRSLLLYSPTLCDPPRGLQHARPPCPLASPGACLNSCSLSRWCHPKISSSVIPFFSCLQSFPASGCFPVNQLFTSDGQSTSASVSVLSMNIQCWLPLKNYLCRQSNVSAFSYVVKE